MKKLFLGLMLSVFTLAASFAQVDQYSDYSEYTGYNDYSDHTGYDGDFFSLEGAIDIFKRSHSIEDFERRLNREDTYVNNLDLNQDGRTDYIRVEHRRQGKFHAIVLQVPIDRRHVQDIAVIEIEKTGRRRAMLQIVGDADLYGEEVIVEPFEGSGSSFGRGGPSADFSFRRGYVNVYYWPSVRHMFGRGYRVYASPYYWDYYPSYWSPWRPCAWNVFRPRVVIFQRHYHVVYVHRLRRVHNFYRPFRATCPAVFQRTTVVRNSGRRSTYSRASQERLRSNKNVRKGNAKANNGILNSTRTERSKVTRNTRTTKRVEKSSTRAGAPKVNRSERGSGTNTQRYEPKTKKKTRGASKTQRSTRTTQKKSRTSTSRKPSTRSTKPAKRKTTTKRNSPSRNKTTRSTTKRSRTKTTTKRSKPSRKTTTRSSSKRSSSKSRKRN